MTGHGDHRCLLTSEVGGGGQPERRRAPDMGEMMFYLTGIALAIGLPTGLVGGLCTVVNLLAIMACRPGFGQRAPVDWCRGRRTARRLIGLSSHAPRFDFGVSPATPNSANFFSVLISNKVCFYFEFLFQIQTKCVFVFCFFFLSKSVFFCVLFKFKSFFPSKFFVFLYFVHVFF